MKSKWQPTSLLLIMTYVAVIMPPLIKSLSQHRRHSTHYTQYHALIMSLKSIETQCGSNHLLICKLSKAKIIIFFLQCNSFSFREDNYIELSN